MNTEIFQLFFSSATQWTQADLDGLRHVGTRKISSIDFFVHYATLYSMLNKCPLANQFSEIFIFQSRFFIRILKNAVEEKRKKSIDRWMDEQKKE